LLTACLLLLFAHPGLAQQTTDLASPPDKMLHGEIHGVQNHT
jgi:hypothetical protein